MPVSSCECKAIIFDLGRVLVDIDLQGGLLPLLCEAERGESSADLLPRLLREPQFRAYSTGRLTPEEFHTAVCERFSLSLSFVEFRAKWCDIFRPMPGMATLFAELAERYTIGILSDTDPLHWAYLRERFSFLQMVERPTLSFAVGCMKPDPTIYVHAAEMAGVLPTACFFADDLAVNVEGARQVGMLAERFCGVEDFTRTLQARGLL